jgi:hypothetical protein
MRRFVRLLEHPGLSGAVRVVTVEAAPFFGGIVDGRLVLEGKRPLELGVAVRAGIRSVQGQLRPSFVQRKVALAAGDYRVVHRVTEGLRELSLYVCVTAEAKLELRGLEQPRFLGSMDPMAA